MDEIILASKSKVRKKILDKNGILNKVVASNVDEDLIKKSLLQENATPEMISKEDHWKKFTVKFQNPDQNSGIFSIEVKETMREVASNMAIVGGISSAGGSTNAMRLSRARSVASFSDCEFSDVEPLEPPPAPPAINSAFP